MIGPDTAVIVSAGVVTVAGASAAVYSGAKKVHRFAEEIRDFLGDWKGVPERPGHDRSPGVPERLRLIETRVANVEAQLVPNGGSSLRDAVDRIERTPPNPHTHQE